MENQEAAFLIFGIAFFLYVIFIAERADERRWERKMTELAEFAKTKKRKQTDDPKPIRIRR